MELFTVNRYTESSTSTVKHNDVAANEDELLQKLLKKAEKRKRKTEAKAAEATAKSEETVDAIESKESEIASSKQENILPKSPLEEEQKPVAEEAPTPDTNDFQVLGADAEAAAAKRPKVQMVLPSWLTHPTIIAGDSLRRDEAADADSDEASLKNQPYLEKYTRRALKQMKIKRLFPVQRVVIPWILKAHDMPAPFRPRDICVSAPTGSGKTLAFAIPIVQLLVNRVECKVRALVVLPVAELALQVYKVINALCRNTELEVCLLSKQHRLEDEQEKLVELYKGIYYSKVDIVVTTPGRLVDHLHATKGFCLKALQFLVIDEADRIMDAVFQNWLYHLDSHVRETTDQLLAGRMAPLCYAELLASYGKQPHKLLFSATLSQDPEKLQNLRLFQPKLFTTVLTNIVPMSENNSSKTDSAQLEDRGQFIGKYTTPAELSEQYCVTELRLKPLTLFALIMENGWKRFLCFTNSNDTSNRLTLVLEKLCQSETMHIEQLSANLTAKARRNTLESFSRGKIQGIICSDALARGIDVANVDIVVSYEVPRHIKTYIHRVGRTARAGRPGTAITLLAPNEKPQFDKMLSDGGKSVTIETSVSSGIEEKYAHIYNKALMQLRETLESEKAKKIVEKKRNARKAILHKSTEQLTFMERLQQKVTDTPSDNPATKKEKQAKPLEIVHKKTIKQKFDARKRKAIMQ